MQSDVFIFYKKENNVKLNALKSDILKFTCNVEVHISKRTPAALPTIKWKNWFCSWKCTVVTKRFVPNTQIHTHTYIYVQVKIRTYIFFYIHIHIHYYIRIYTYIHIYTYMHTLYIYVYIRLYTYITYMHTYTRILCGKIHSLDVNTCDTYIYH